MYKIRNLENNKNQIWGRSIKKSKQKIGGEKLENIWVKYKEQMMGDGKNIYRVLMQI